MGEARTDPWRSSTPSSRAVALPGVRHDEVLTAVRVIEHSAVDLTFSELRGLLGPLFGPSQMARVFACLSARRRGAAWSQLEAIQTPTSRSTAA